MESFSITDIGLHRKMNQDFYYSSEYPVGNLPNLFIVADGMGGHNAGEYASKHTIEVMASVVESSLHIVTEDILKEAIEKANEELIWQAAQDLSMWGMGTTVVAAVIADGWVHVANVGDSRLYLINRDIRQITRDHSYVAEMVRRGEIAKEASRTHPDRNIITRAVGVTREIDIDFFEEKIRPGDKILLCSDGLTNMVEDEEIQKIAAGHKSTAEAAVRLIETANRNGGRDNITVVIIDPFSK